MGGKKLRLHHIYRELFKNQATSMLFRAMEVEKSKESAERVEMFRN